MASKRLTITLPAETAKRVREKARKSGKPVSRVIADELHKGEQAELRDRLVRGYRASANESRKTAAEWLPTVIENWPDA